MEKKPEEKEEPHDEAYFNEEDEGESSFLSSAQFFGRSRKKEQIFRPQAQAERIKDALARAKEVEKQPQKQAEEQPELIRENTCL